MDSVRSCYSAVWNIPGIGPVPGVYCWAPSTAQHVPDPHYLHAGIWKDGDRWPWPDTGEVTPASRLWSNGAQASTVNYAVTVTGVEDTGCVGCGSINGTHVMEGVIGDCVAWNGQNFSWPDPGFGCGGLKRWILRIGASPWAAQLMCVRVSGSAPLFWARYVRTLAEGWTFGVPQVFTYLTANEAACGGWPATLTVYPVPAS